MGAEGRYIHDHGLAAFTLCSLTLIACAGAGAASTDAGAVADAGIDAGIDAGTDAGIDAGTDAGIDAGTDAGIDAGTDAGIDAGPMTDAGPADGTPTRTNACTPFDDMSGVINTSYGRLDGIVTYVVPLNGSATCNGDDGHIHIQVLVGDETYDIAVDVGSSNGDQTAYETDMALPGVAWSAGWHGTEKISYATLGLDASQFTAWNPSPLATHLEEELASVNHITIYGTAYTPTPSNGAHDIHFHNGKDGALFLQPLSSPAHAIFFNFSGTSW